MQPAYVPIRLTNTTLILYTGDCLSDTFPIFMLKQVASFSLLALLSASCATAVEQPKEEVVRIEVKPYEKTWQLPGGTPAEQYVLAELDKNKPKSQIGMPLQRSWETLNLKATSIPTSAREGLEFLTGIVIGVGMALFSGPA